MCYIATMSLNTKSARIQNPVNPWRPSIPAPRTPRPVAHRTDRALYAKAPDGPQFSPFLATFVDNTATKVAKSRPASLSSLSFHIKSPIHPVTTNRFFRLRSGTYDDIGRHAIPFRYSFDEPCALPRPPTVGAAASGARLPCFLTRGPFSVPRSGEMQPCRGEVPGRAHRWRHGTRRQGRCDPGPFQSAGNVMTVQGRLRPTIVHRLETAETGRGPSIDICSLLTVNSA